MNRDQSERITKILNSAEFFIPYQPLLEIVNEEIDDKGYCSPIMYPISKAVRKSTAEQLDACHQLRSNWRLARWDYMKLSQLWVETK